MAKAKSRPSLALVMVVALLSGLMPLLINVRPAVAADVVLPPILLTGNDAEDSGSGSGNPAARVDTWQYQIKNPNPFDLTATIQANTGAFDIGATGPPTGAWVNTQVISVLVPANSQTAISKGLAKPPALGATIDRQTYGFRAVWDDYPTVESNYVGLRWPTLLVIQASLGAPFTDPGSPFVGSGGGIIHGLIDGRGPDFSAAFACEFDAAGNPTGDYSYHWWVHNTAFTGNPELLHVELARPGGSLMPGLTGLPRQTVAWNEVRAAAEVVDGADVTVEGWQEARGWFRPAINAANPGGTAADNTWPWNGENPPGSVWSLNSSPYNKHTRMLLHADDCANKYSNLPAPNSGVPSVAIITPVPGTPVSGVTLVQVEATDDDPVGSLRVDVSTDGGTTWQSAPWNTVTSRYQFSWDTTALPDGAATVDARATDSDANTANALAVRVTIDNVAETSLVVAAADIGSCGLTSDDATGALLDTIFAAESGTVAIAGDVAYPNGTTADFVCFDDAWGQHKALINPAPGNHEYDTPGAPAYFEYFGTRAGDPAQGYYAYTIDEHWIGIALNSNCAEIAGGCSTGGAQEQWLRGVLAANASKNVLAFWHHPRWANNNYNDNADLQPFWKALYDYGADLVLVGHEHHYERYQPLDASGSPDPTFGIREFIVGAGGTTLRGQRRPPSSLSEEQYYDDHGVLKLYLGQNDYSWEFVTVGGNYSDSGTQAVHGSPGISPTVSVTSPPGGVVSGTVTVQVDANDDDPAGSLLVDVSTDGGAIWHGAPWNPATNRYEYAWDTTAVGDGLATIRARATDSNGNSGDAPVVNVTVNNGGGAPYRDVVLADGAWIYWRLGENADTTVVDELGSNHQTYLGSPGLGAPALIADSNTAVDFDGIDDTVALENATEINREDPALTKTIELWFNAADVSTRQVLVEQGSVSRGLNIYLLDESLYAGVYNTSDSGGDTPWGPVFLSTPVVANTIYHVVFVFDQPADTVGLFVNGTLADSSNGIGQLYPHSLSAIGSQRAWTRYHDGAQFGDIYFYDGILDEIAIYPSALSASIVANHYVAGSGAASVVPTVAITAPSSGTTISATTTVQVSAVDDDPTGTLNVEVSTDGGVAWSPASWNGASGRYEYSWDTTTAADGPATIDARATDSDANTASAGPINVTIGNAASGSYADTVLGDGAWVYWRLGETAGTTMTDELGTNDESYSGGPGLGAPSLVGDANTAVDFDGIDDHVNLLNAVEINRQNPALTKTIDFWFDADDVSGRHVILEQGSLTRGLNIYLFGGRLYAGVFNTSNNGGDTPWGPVFLSSAVSANTTYHVALVFDQPTDTVALYLNGESVDSSDGIGELHRHSVSAIAGPRSWARYHDTSIFGGDFYFDGTLDEFAIYPTALDPATLNAHYTAGTS